jgi:hypothetical protein
VRLQIGSAAAPDREKREIPVRRERLAQCLGLVSSLLGGTQATLVDVDPMIEKDSGKGRLSLGNAYVGAPLGIAVAPRFERGGGAGGESPEIAQQYSEQWKHGD